MPPEVAYPGVATLGLVLPGLVPPVGGINGGSAAGEWCYRGWYHRLRHQRVAPLGDGAPEVWYRHLVAPLWVVAPLLGGGADGCWCRWGVSPLGVVPGFRGHYWSLKWKQQWKQKQMQIYRFFRSQIVY